MHLNPVCAGMVKKAEKMSLSQTQQRLVECIFDAIAITHAKTFDYCTEYLGYLPFGMYHWICVNGRDIANLPFEFSRDDLDRLEAENLFRKTRYWVDPTDELHTKTTYEINGP